MSRFVRSVPGRPGVTLVQIVDKSGGQYKIVKHIGSARTEAELAVKMEEAREFLNPGQGVPDFDTIDMAYLDASASTSSTTTCSSGAFGRADIETRQHPRP